MQRLIALLKERNVAVDPTLASQKICSHGEMVWLLVISLHSSYCVPIARETLSSTAPYALLLDSDTSYATLVSNTDNTPTPPRMTPAPATTPNDVVRGTLELLILKALSLEPMHGWAITQRLEQLSRDALRVGQGSLYPALQRLEEKGWVDSEWSATPENRRAKYYELTKSGRRALSQEAETWRRYVDMVELILHTT